MRWLFRLFTVRRQSESYLPLTTERLQMLVQEDRQDLDQQFLEGR